MTADAMPARACVLAHSDALRRVMRGGRGVVSHSIRLEDGVIHASRLPWTGSRLNLGRGQR